MELKRNGIGDHGYLTVKFSPVTDEWKRPVFNARASRIGADSKARPGELPAGWAAVKHIRPRANIGLFDDATAVSKQTSVDRARRQTPSVVGCGVPHDGNGAYG